MDDMEEKKQQTEPDIGAHTSDEKALILNALEDGLFFLNESGDLVDGFSGALENIIDQEVTPGMAFFEILAKRVPENILNNSLEFIDLLFRDDLDDNTLDELNPLQKVEFHFENNWGLWTSSKFLSFRFKRVMNDAKIERVICTVRDITSTETLAKKIDEIEETTNKQMEWLVNLLAVSPPLLKEFMDVTELELNFIDSELKGFTGEDDFPPVLHRILKSLHQLSNNASLLNLNFFTEKLNQCEIEVNKLKGYDKVGGTDFVPVVIQLGEVRQMVKDMTNLMQRFKPYSNSLRPTRRHEGRVLLRTISNLVTNLSRQLDKQISFKAESFDPSVIPYSHQPMVREFLIVLIRFSIYYGIETPEERKSNNKDPVGQLEVDTFSANGLCGFKLRHDGRLIRIERLLQETIRTAETKPQKDHPFGNNQLGSEVIRLLFMPSLATPSLSEAEYIREIFSEMEMVKKKLKMHRGKIKITFTSENFCEYTISMPVK